MSAASFSISVRQASAQPTSAIAAATERCSATRDATARLHRGVPGRDDLDQVGVDEKLRAFEHDRGDVGLIARQRMNNRGRRIDAAAKRLGERAAHQRRRVVEQHDHRAFGDGAIVVGQIGIEIGAGQRPGRFRAQPAGAVRTHCRN